MATIYDAVDVAALPAGADYYLCYIDGSYQTYAAVRAKFPTANILTVTVTGKNRADICDVEFEDATPEIAAVGYRAGLYHTIYSSKSSKSYIDADLPGVAYNWFSADPTGTPHLTAGAVATQWAWPKLGSPGNYDISITNGVWPNVPLPTPSPTPGTNIIKRLSGKAGTLNAPVVAVVPTNTGKGYTLVAADGGTFNYGDAAFLGSLAGQHLNAPIVDAKRTPDGNGLVLAATDGGVFCFGSAVFHGSMGGQHLNAPVVGVGMYPDGSYWLTAADGGVFAFGSAPFEGSAA